MSDQVVGSKWAVGAITDTLRQEVAAKNIRATVILTGAISTEPGNSVQHKKTAEAMAGFLTIAVPPQCIANAIAFAMPANVGVQEVAVRPAVQTL